MKSTFRLGLAFVIGLALVGSAFAQGNMPDKSRRNRRARSVMPPIIRSLAAC